MENCPNCHKTLDNIEAKLEFCSACQWDSDNDEQAFQPSVFMEWTSFTLNDEVFTIPVLSVRYNEKIFCCIGLHEKLEPHVQEIGTTMPNMKAKISGRLSDVMHLELKKRVIDSLSLYQWPFEQFPNPVLIILTKQ